MAGRPRSLVPRAAAAALVLAVASACSSDGARATRTTVRVEATDTQCTIDRSTVPPGEIRFEVVNRGSIITEVYLYAPRDRVIGEIENVEPNADAAFTVTAGGGSYEVACKPGQLGDGVRAPLQITGPLDANQTESADAATARGVDVFALDVRMAADHFAAELADLVVVTGQTVRFRVHNQTTERRAFEVVAPDQSTPLGRTPDLAPGGTAELAVRFTSSGTYVAIDPVDDHRGQGSEARFQVID